MPVTLMNQLMLMMVIVCLMIVQMHVVVLLPLMNVEFVLVMVNSYNVEI